MKTTIKNFIMFVAGAALVTSSTNMSVKAYEEIEVRNPYSIAAVVAAAREVDDNAITRSMQVLEVRNDTYRIFVYKNKTGVVTELRKIDKNGDGWQQLIDAFAHLQELCFRASALSQTLIFFSSYIA